MRKLLLLFFFSVNFLILPSAVADTTIIDTITQQQAQDLKIQVPPNTTPGSHTLLIEVLNSDGSSFSKKEIQFCMDLNGIVHWDNNCPGVAPIADTSTLAKIRDVNQLPAYSPLQEPKKTADKTVVALAVLTAIGVGGAAASAGGGSGQGDLETIDLEELEYVEREEQWGDRKGPWRTPMTPLTDGFFARFILRVSRFSPLLARASNDGNYLRALLGSLALPIYFGAIVSAVAVAASRQFQAMPPKEFGLVILMAFGSVDALAGMLAAITLFLATLVTGHIYTFNGLLTMIGVGGICYAPTLIGNFFRPFRRLINDKESAWERLADYAISPILTGWIVSNMVGGLNGLGGKQFEIATHTVSLMQISMGLIIIRLIFEDIATYLFPGRLNATRAQMQDPVRFQPAVSLFIRAAVFFIAAQPFVGNSIQLWFGTILFITPYFIEAGMGPNFPKVGKLGAWLPGNSLEILYLVIVGGLLAAWNQKLLPNPKDFLMWGFVILGLPAFTLGILWGFAEEDSENKWQERKFGRISYRIGGVVVFTLILLLAKGVDLAGYLYRLF
jgi:uncharacterized membrane protein YhdT